MFFAKEKEMAKRPAPEPYKIKMVEPIRLISRQDRQKALEKAGYNTFLLDSQDVYIDLLTDSGTSAMSQEQWSALMRGDEAYAGSASFYRLVEAIKDVFGYPLVVPTHQGRAAEHLFFKLALQPGDIVPMNMYFTTTRHHLELAGGIFYDTICSQAHDTASTFKFKGNMDINKLEDLYQKRGERRFPVVVMAPNVNMAGGQPFSLGNLKEVFQWCREKGIKLYLDITRIAENAYFIKTREEGYQDKTIQEILREICAHSDGAWMSAKKDGLVNIGGFLAFHSHEQELFEKCRNEVVVYEGLHTYGGMAGRDMDALAQGLRDVCSFEYLRARITQVEYLHSLLDENNVPLVHPCGGHGVFLDAAKFLSHLDQDEFPAQMLAAQIYLEGGIRSMERGNVSAGRDPQTGKNRRPKLELVRLTIPRRVYTQSHIEYTAEAIVRCYQRRDKIPGLKFTYEPKVLRFFQARFCPLSCKKD
ncbi:MAG: tryptophanase [Planctomycetota bacterium]|nr:MAG: tryptophanase [Planctomycetota bacterium]